MKIAVVAIAYNRLNSIKRLLNSLSGADYCNEKIDLIISIDKSDTTVVEDYADEYYWPFGEKIVRKHKDNLGLRKHILSQGEAFETYDALVILEDDIIVSPAFYKYGKQAIMQYCDNDQIAGISLYSYPLNYQNNNIFEPYKTGYDVYFMQTAVSWGQIWLKNQWKAFYKWYLNNTDFKMSADIPPVLFNWKKSWLKYHTRYCIENDKYFVFPYYSFSSNCCDIGVHAIAKYNSYQTVLQTDLRRSLILPKLLDDAACYDSFFENIACYNALGMNKNILCLDINGQHKEYHKRYILTTKLLNYKILKSYGLFLRPIEANVLADINGNEIYLYDSSSPQKNINCNNKDSLKKYNLRLISWATVLNYVGVKSFASDIIKGLKKRINIK